MKHNTGDPKLDEANLVHDVADVIFHEVERFTRTNASPSAKQLWDWSQDVARKVIPEARNPIA